MELVDLEQGQEQGLVSSDESDNEMTDVRVDQKKTKPRLMSLICTLALPYVTSVKDLKNVRLVCRLWKDISLQQWRNTATLRLLWRKVCNSFCHSCNQFSKQADYSRKTLHISEYFNLLLNSKEGGGSGPDGLAERPFSRYQIGYCDLLQSGTGEGANWERFWDVCGPHVKFLFLDHCSVPDTRYGMSFRQILSEKCVALEELWINLVQTEMSTEMGIQLLDNDDIGCRSDLVPIPSVESMSLSICKKGKNSAGWHTQQFTPNRSQWRTLLQLTPNLKNLSVTSSVSDALRALLLPSITGQLIRLTKLAYLSRRMSSPTDIPELKGYMDRTQPPLPLVEVIMERNQWNRSYFREALGRFFWRIVRCDCSILASQLILGFHFLYIVMILCSVVWFASPRTY